MVRLVVCGHRCCCDCGLAVITEAIAGAVLGLLRTVLGFLPDDMIDYPNVFGIGTTFGNMVGPFDSIAPVHEIVDVLDVSLSVVIPALLVFKLTVWLYGKIPMT